MYNKYIPVDRSKHPVNQWKVGDRIKKGDVRPSFEQEYDRV